MKQTERSTVHRRDWLKIASLGGVANLLSSSGAVGQDAPAKAGKVSGIVFMVSDGMSHGVLTMAQSFSLLTRKRDTSWWQLVNAPNTTMGLMDNASANSLVTDSAAAASAWGGGQRINNGAINFSPQGTEITPIAAVLKKQSRMRIGLVTTATVTHATPAGFAASMPSRKDEHLIAPQYLERVDVIMGGGAEFFDPKVRNDRKDIFSIYAKAGHQILRHRDDLLQSRSEKLLGIFSSGHLPYTVDRDQDPAMQAVIPTLEEMTGAALSRFLIDDKPFLLQVEGARIDHAAHLNDIAGLLHDQLAFDDAVAKVLKMTAGREDILVVVTSDHGNANPGLNGSGQAYTESTQRFERIPRLTASHEHLFTLWKKMKNPDAGQLRELIAKHLDVTLQDDEIEALAAVLKEHPVVEWSHQLQNPEGLLGQFMGNHTGIGWTGTTHTSDSTLISAIGPQADRFKGIVKNSDVFGHLVEMLG